MKEPPYKNVTVTSYAIPANAPEQVEAAWSRFDEHGSTYAEAHDLLKNRAARIKDAQRADLERNRDDLAAGRTVKDPDRCERKAAAEIAAAEATEAAYLALLDQDGDELLIAIDEARDEWLADAGAELTEAYAKYVEHLHAARVTAHRVGEVQGTVDWLNRWRLIHGDDGILWDDVETSYTGPTKVTVDTRELRRHSSVSAASLLTDLERSATGEQPPEREPTRRFPKAAA